MIENKDPVGDEKLESKKAAKKDAKKAEKAAKKAEHRGSKPQIIAASEEGKLISRIKISFLTFFRLQLIFHWENMEYFR